MHPVQMGFDVLPSPPPRAAGAGSRSLHRAAAARALDDAAAEAESSSPWFMPARSVTHPTALGSAKSLPAGGSSAWGDDDDEPPARQPRARRSAITASAADSESAQSARGGDDDGDGDAFAFCLAWGDDDSRDAGPTTTPAARAHQTSCSGGSLPPPAFAPASDAQGCPSEAAREEGHHRLRGLPSLQAGGMLIPCCRGGAAAEEDSEEGAASEAELAERQLLGTFHVGSWASGCSSGGFLERIAEEPHTASGREEEEP